jgi:PAS domain S-box-containing protein
LFNYRNIFKEFELKNIVFDINGDILDWSENFSALYDNLYIKKTSFNILNIISNISSVINFIHKYSNLNVQKISIRTPKGISEFKARIERLNKLFILWLYDYEPINKDFPLDIAFNDLIETFPDPIFVYDNNDTIVYANQAFGVFHGQASKDIIGKHISSIYPSDISETFISNNNMVREQIQENFNISIVKNSKGEEIIASAFLKPIIRKEDSSVIGIVGSARNMTEIINLEEANSKKEEELLLADEILNNSPVKIYFTDKNNIFRYANHAFCDYIGKSLSEVIGKSNIDVFGQEVGKKVDSINSNLFISKSQITYETIIKRFDKQLICEITKRLHNNKKGDLLGIIGIARDITQEKNLEKKLIDAQRLECISILASGFAHDFKNILNGIHGYVDLLLFQEYSYSKVNFLNKINVTINKASELIAKLLEIGKQKSVDKKPIILNTIVNDVINIVKFSTLKKIDFKLDLANDLLEIQANSSQIFQMIMNLVVNSIDAIEREGKIEIITRNLEILKIDNQFTKGIFLEIKDNGIGIDEIIQSKIFEPFFSTKVDCISKSGSGLGLSIVNHIIKEHQGKIELTSKINKGTVFKIFLPSDSHFKNNWT